MSDTTTEALQQQISKLKKEVKRLNRQIKKQRYGLVWMDVPEKFEEESEDKIPILQEVPELAIDNQDGKPTHILIEGDNYHALTCLNYTHKGKVSVIYLDPPYNTGNNDFTYNDSRFTTEYPDGKAIKRNDPLRHSSWLSFMEKRLRLAYNLLSEDGVMFISIDDCEQANLKLLCDSIFEPDNFIGTFFWKRTDTPPALSNKIRRKLEYVICYAKVANNNRKFAQGYVDGGDAPLLNGSNSIGRLTFPAGCVHFNIPDGTYFPNNQTKISLLENVVVKNGLNDNAFSAEARFKWKQDNLEAEIREGTFFVVKSNKFSIRYQKAEKDLKSPSNIIDSEVGVGTNEDATKSLEEIGLGGIFNYAKPVSLIKYLIKVPFWEVKNITVLDFFAGSGTTLQSVLELNEESRNIQCILVQIPERCYEIKNERKVALDGYEDVFNAGYETISEITYQRCLRLLNGNKINNITTSYGDSLKYYKTAFVGKNTPNRATDEDKLELSKKASCLLAIAENTLYKVEENDFFYIYNDRADRHTAIYAQEDLCEYDAFCQRVESLKGHTTVYIFSWGTADEFQADFDLMPDVEVKPIPKPILDIYKTLNQ